MGQRQIVGAILEALNVYYENDCDLTEAQKASAGFFYKKLREPYYEAGIERNIRVVLKKEKSKCIAVLAGNHDQIRKFLVSV